MLLRQRLEPVDHLRNHRDRHRDVLAEDVLALLHQNPAEVAAGVPDPLPLRLALGDPVVDAVEDLDHLGQLEKHLFAVVAVLLDDDHRLVAGLEAGRKQVADDLQRALVHQLQGRREVARLEQPADGRGGVLDGLEAHHGGGVVAGPGDQLHDDAGDDPEGALRADEEVHQAVAGGALADSPAEFEDAAVGQHDRHPDHVVGGQAVLQAVRATGVAGDVAADGRDHLAGGVGRIHQALGRGTGVEVAIDHARPGHRHQVGGVDLQLGQPLEAQDDATREGDRPADQSAAGSPGGERRPRLRAEPDDGRHLLGVGGQDGRREAMLEEGAVVLVVLETLVHDDVRLADHRAEAGEEVPQRVASSSPTRASSRSAAQSSYVRRS